MKKASFFLVLVWLVLLGSTSGHVYGQAVSSGKPAPEPQLTILDTDIGDDLDDAFALALVLRSPELKLLGITTSYSDTELKARIVDRYLTAVGSKIPIAAGVPTHVGPLTQGEYGKRWPGKTYGDGVAFLLDQIRAHPDQITLIAIGPLTNLGAAIKQDPATFKKLKRVVIMGGSIRRGYGGPTAEVRPPSAEWNIKADPASAAALLASGVPVYMMPLDSTQIKLKAEDQEKIYAHGSPLTDQVTLLYHQWHAATHFHALVPTLYDPVAVTYAIRPELCPATSISLTVDEEGFTKVVEGGKANANVCLQADEKGFMEFFLNRILSEP